MRADADDLDAGALVRGDVLADPFGQADRDRGEAGGAGDGEDVDGAEVGADGAAGQATGVRHVEVDDAQVPAAPAVGAEDEVDAGGGDGQRVQGEARAERHHGLGRADSAVVVHGDVHGDGLVLEAALDVGGAARGQPGGAAASGGGQREQDGGEGCRGEQPGVAGGQGGDGRHGGHREQAQGLLIGPPVR